VSEALQQSKPNPNFPYPERLPLALFKDNNARFLDRFSSTAKPAAKSLILLKGVEEIPIHNTDINWPDF
jgi:hypothetical protein